MKDNYARIQGTLSCRNLEPMTFKQIANLERVSPQAVHKHLDCVHDKLRKQVVDEQISFKLCA